MAAALAPPTEDDMERWIVELGLITAKRSMGDASAELFLTAYTKRLVDYPADIVRETLQSWAGKWFPTWGELKELLDAQVAERAVIGAALSVHIAATAQKSAPELKGKTADERHAELMQAAFWARKSGDHDGAREFEDRAVEELALEREATRQQQEH